MRIVGGKYKGRVFNPGKKFKARPTTDLAKEGLFNILENRYDFEEMRVLDLFSGTGSMGYEFVSRSCDQVIMVENNYTHFRFIQETLKNLEIKNAWAVKDDVFKFVKKSPARFDIVFADPPFELQRLPEIPDNVLDAQILNENGILILEHPKNFDFSKHTAFQELRKYGKVNFTFFTARKKPL